jgi:flagellar hook-length control protein FliK
MQQKVATLQPEVAKQQPDAAAPATAAVSDGTQKEVPVPVQKGEVPAGNAPVPEQLSTPSEGDPAELTASTLAQGGQRGAERTDTRTASGARRPQAAESGRGAEAAVAPALGAEEGAGSKNATASVSSAKSVPLQANLGQSGSGSAGKGNDEHKAQGKGADQVQPMGFGVQEAPVAEAAQPEAKPAGSKSALHDSILSQIKDGVVTHDGKGSSQISIRLNPGELGELKIQVRMEDNRLNIEVHADNRMVKDLLMSNLDTLKQALSGKNFTMEGFDVSTGGGFNSPLPEERGNSRQQAMLRNAKSGGYPGEEEGRVNYVTEEVNNLLDVRF